MKQQGLVVIPTDSATRPSTHAAFREVTEVAFALPFSFADEDYEQMLTDIATRLGPALGWHARTSG
jgi:hypothetical protein